MKILTENNQMTLVLRESGEIIKFRLTFRSVGVRDPLVTLETLSHKSVDGTNTLGTKEFKVLVAATLAAQKAKTYKKAIEITKQILRKRGLIKSFEPKPPKLGDLFQFKAS